MDKLKPALYVPFEEPLSPFQRLTVMLAELAQQA
jgi:hypothetical protein